MNDAGREMVCALLVKKKEIEVDRGGEQEICRRELSNKMLCLGA